MLQFIYEKEKKKTTAKHLSQTVFNARKPT
jgi:hypothetical protein